MASVTLTNIKKTYDGKTPVLHGVNLTVNEGEFVVLVGPSGCGKSTLLRMMAGLEDITGGDLSIDGARVNDAPPRQRDVAMVFQDYALYPHKTVFENMAFGLRLRKLPEAEINQRVGDAAKLLKMEHLLERRPAALSGGQRQRVAIGRAIVRRPKVFLFDEPLSNLDAQLRGEMRAEIKKLHQRLNATIVYVTHDQVEAMTLADRIAVMQSGHVLQYDTPETIYSKPANTFVASFMGSPPMNLIPASLSENGLTIGTQSLNFKPAGLAQGALTLGVRPEHITLNSPNNAPNNVITLQATLSLLEPLGAETLATVSLDFGKGESKDLTVRLGGTYKQALGSAVTLSIAPEHLQFFAADSGSRV